MKPAELLLNYVIAAKPWMIFAALLLFFLLVLLRGFSTWPSIKSFVRRKVLRLSQYDIAKTIQRLECFSHLRDLRLLYPEILNALTEIVSAEGASLIIREKNSFQVKAVCGVKPLAFHVSDVNAFFEVLAKLRTIVTKDDLIKQKQWALVRAESLRYCVQLNAEACVPIFIGEELIGIINLGRRKAGRYDEETIELIKLLSIHFSNAINNACLYEDLIKQNRHLEEASTLKSQLLANVSHELRTPLTAVIGLAELMAEGVDGRVNTEQISHLEMIRKNGLRLLATVSSMVDLSKLEANQLKLSVHKFDLRRLVDTVAVAVPINKYTQFSIDLDAKTPGVYGDEARISQVVKHLLENAAKFTKRGSIAVCAAKTGEMLKVCVQDTGIGISQEQRKKIFEGFTQANGSSTREYQGLGLGLTISRRIVELHGGRLWFESKEGKGSQFYFTLPLKPVSLRAPELHNSLPQFAANS